MTSKLSKLLGLSALSIVVLLATACGAGKQAAATSATATPVTSLLAVQEDVQEPDTETIQVIGVVESITDDVIAVNGLTIDTAGAGIDGVLATGVTVQIQGRQGPEGAVTAQYVWVLESTPAPTATAERNIIPFVIEGPVQALSGNRVRIHGFDLELDEDPRLQALQVGDVVRIGGEVDDDRLNDLFDDGIDDDIDDERYVTIRNTQIGFLSNQVYASEDGQVWRDSGSCADAPPGWASASEWRSRCSGEFGGGPPATDASTSSSGTSTGTSGASSSGGDGSSSSVDNPAPPPPTGGDGDSSSSSGLDNPPPTGGDGDSSSGSGADNPPPPPPPPPPAGGDGDSSSGSGS